MRYNFTALSTAAPEEIAEEITAQGKGKHRGGGKGGNTQPWMDLVGVWGSFSTLCNIHCSIRSSLLPLFSLADRRNIINVLAGSYIL